MSNSTLENGFGLLALLLFCAVALTLPACSSIPSGGNARFLVGSLESTWGNEEPQADFRAEQTVWQQDKTRFAASARFSGNLAGETSFASLAGVRIEQGAIGADLLMGSDRRLFGLDYTWQPIAGFLLKMGLQQDDSVISAKTAIELQLNRQWALTGEYQSSELATLSLIGLRGSW